MNSIQNDVKAFMEAAGQPAASSPTVPDKETRILHGRLILEEALETIKAMGLVPFYNVCAHTFDVELSGEPNMVEVYDGLADTSYVVNGAANAWGLDLQRGHDEAHDSNMSKFIDGHRREDGKWIKGPSYRPADFKKLIEEQTK